MNVYLAWFKSSDVTNVNWPQVQTNRIQRFRGREGRGSTGDNKEWFNYREVVFMPQKLVMKRLCL